MATEKQIEANRLNAQKSTGPKSPEAKAKVSMNSLRHGMRARALVLRSENEGRFHQLCDELEAEWQPQTTTEMALLEKMAVAQWKLVRAERREAMVCEVYTDQKQEAMLEPLAKFQERFDRAFFRALRELEKLQKIRRQTAPPPAKEVPAVATPEPRPPLGPDTPNPPYVISPHTTASEHHPAAPVNADGSAATGFSAAPSSTADSA